MMVLVRLHVPFTYIHICARMASTRLMLHLCNEIVILNTPFLVTAQNSMSCNVLCLAFACYSDYFTNLFISIFTILTLCFQPFTSTLVAFTSRISRQHPNRIQFLLHQVLGGTCSFYPEALLHICKNIQL